MIIKEINIRNFRSYYGNNNSFNFSDGLTLIIGDNGDGKTTFFEALQWLLNTSLDKANIDQVSEKRKSELDPGDSDTLSVQMLFEHNGEKSIEKTFTFEKTEDGTFKVGRLMYLGYESNGVERISVDGKSLMNRCYDAFIQRFSMFKGESELNVFNNKTALKDLVNKFSDIKKFDKLVENAKLFAEKSNGAYLKEMQSDKKVAQRAKILEDDIKAYASRISEKKCDIIDISNSLDTYSRKLDDLEGNKEASERFKDLQERLKAQEDKKINLKAQIERVDYNHSLLDKYWILCAFPSVLQEFKQKCSAISKEKRLQERDYDKQKAKELGKLEAFKYVQGALSNGSTELPWYLPNQETMEEMLNDHICKVCGREAPIGSDAYNFMLHRLEDYKKHVEAKIQREIKKTEIQNNELFKFDHIENLHNLSISLSGSQEQEIAKKAEEIIDRIELVARLRGDLKNIEDKINDLIDEKSRLLIQAGNVSEQVLERDSRDIRGLYNQRQNAAIKLTNYQNELKSLQDQYQKLQKELDELDPESSQVKVYRDVHRALEEISKAFSYAKQDNLRRFLSDLENKANEYLVDLSANDFHGEIRLIQTLDESAEIKLFSSNGTEIKKPSGSQKTVMYISVLFAISDFTIEKRDEDYPLIFDAATSSFGDSKESEFYNVIDKIDKQCIIVTKDFISKGKLLLENINNLTCSVYRIKKDSNFDPLNMATIMTTIEKVK